jgi:hypothetical protein
MGQVERKLYREALLALLVVALTFLNFGHSSAVFAAGGRVVVTATSICGDQQTPYGGDHFACHACRPAAAVLPPAPAGIVPIDFAAETIAYAAPLIAAPLLAFRLAANPRAPPAA